MTGNMICRATRSLLRSSLHFAPIRLRDWGSAMLAELEAIEDPRDSLRWSLGCLAFVFWELLLAISAGAWDTALGWISARNEGAVMKQARITAASALLLALGFFLLPSFRQAIGVAGDSLNYYPVPWNQRFEGAFLASHAGADHELDRLRIEAVRDRDAKMLAYVAVHEERKDAAADAAEKAVAIDPQWTWVYYVLAGRDAADLRYHSSPESAGWLEKLRNWDPQNAVVYLLQAQRVEQSELTTSHDRDVRKKIFVNGVWLESMEHALDAPKYDAYVQHRLDLERDIARRRGFNDPLRLAVAMLSHPTPTPSLVMAHTYARSILRSASEPSKLAEQAQRVVSFGERLMGADSEMEQLMGEAIALDGYEKLQSVAASESQAFIAARIAELKAVRSEERQRNRASWVMMNAFAVNAAIVDVCFILIFGAAIVIVVSAAASVYRRIQGRHRVSTTLFGAIGTMLVACVVCFVAYLPYARLTAQIMDPRSSARGTAPLLASFFSFAISPRLWFYNPQEQIYIWTGVLVVLTLLALWRLVRQFRPPHAKTPVINSAGA